MSKRIIALGVRARVAVGGGAADARFELGRQSASLPLEASVEGGRARKAVADADATVAQLEVKRLECIKVGGDECGVAIE